MKNFTYHVPTKVVFGTDREREVGKLLHEAGATKVLIIHGRQCSQCPGLLDRIRASLDEAGILYNDIGGVYPPPTRMKANEGIALGRIEDVDFILAIGGPSVVDIAKAVAVGIPNDGDIWDYYTGKRTPKTILPIGVVVTTMAGSGEMSAIAKLTNRIERSSKHAYWHEARPQLAIMNPMLTYPLTPDELYAGIAEIMMITMERYFVHDSTMELTDNICEVLLRVLIRNTQIILREPNNFEARANVMWASALAHNDLTGCGNGWGDITVHDMQKELLGMYNISQGVGLAAVWSSWAKHVYKADIHRFYRYGRTVWNLPREFGTQEEIAVEAIRNTMDFFRQIDMLGPTVAKTTKGIEFNAEELADRVLDGQSQIGSFKVLSRSDVIDVYEDAIRLMQEG
ncbi:MAG: iron-containing alcohol dehydrogenase [Veillonellaceae bacterium]|nr:iron-containing alcohol dehydrogenase [Veillonellaceae bacterium]